MVDEGLLKFKPKVLLLCTGIVTGSLVLLCTGIGTGSLVLLCTGTGSLIWLIKSDIKSPYRLITIFKSTLLFFSVSNKLLRF